jgi:hypothetical protein
MEQQNATHLKHSRILEKLRAEILKRKSNIFERTLLIMLPL